MHLPHLQELTASAVGSTPPACTNRHRGSSRLLSPATPPYMRVRIRRFSSVEFRVRRATEEDRATRSNQSEVRRTGPGGWQCATVHADCPRFEPREQRRSAVGADSQTAPHSASTASRSRIAIYGDSIPPAVAAPRASGCSRSNSSILVNRWRVPWSSVPD
jgi:hypothetical protein